MLPQLEVCGRHAPFLRLGQEEHLAVLPEEHWNKAMHEWRVVEIAAHRNKGAGRRLGDSFSAASCHLAKLWGSTTRKVSRRPHRSCVFPGKKQPSGFGSTPYHLCPPKGTFSCFPAGVHPVVKNLCPDIHMSRLRLHEPRQLQTAWVLYQQSI